VTEALRAAHRISFSYRRSVGGALERFLSGLARAEIWGSLTKGGRVLVPPVDWEPETGEATAALVRLEDTGVVRAWTWVDAPGARQPLDRAFAYALIQLDGADSALLHVVDAGDESAMMTGMRVQAQWRPERSGSILDIRAFVPMAPGEDVAAQRLPAAEVSSARPVPIPNGSARGAAGSDRPSGLLEVVSDVDLEYAYEPGLSASRFFRALAERRIAAGRCPGCGGVYVPPHPQCPACGSGPMAEVELADHGVVTAYTVVHLPFHGMTSELPFVSARIRLDGADVPIAHLLGEVRPEEVHVGQRVEAVWADGEDLRPTWEAIRYFRPAGSFTAASTRGAVGPACDR